MNVHHCHWPGCTRPVLPRMWGCKPHWFSLPVHLRNRIWATYRPGQEITKTPSRQYVAAVKEVRAWIHSASVARKNASVREGKADNPKAAPQLELAL